MKICDERWRNEMLGHAAGEPASGEFARHLMGCAVCSSTLRDGRRRMAEIDAGVPRLADAVASPNAIPRVIAAVHGPKRGARLLDSNWVTAVTALAGLLIAVFAYGRITHEQDRRALSAAAAFDRWRSPTATLLQLPNAQWLSTPPRLGESFYSLTEPSVKKEKNLP